MEKLKEKLWNSKELIIAIFLVLLLLITGSYAWYQYNFSSDKVHIIKAGNLNLILDETTSNGILINNAIPVSDTKGLQSQAYTFTLRNLGSSASSYTLYLVDVGLDENEKLMQDSYVKYSLTKNTDDPKTDLVSTLGERTNRILDSGTIAGKSENNYTLRVWINKDAENDVMGTTFFTRIRVVAESNSNPQTPTTTRNEHIEKVVSYDPTTCPTGEETTCMETDCITNSSAGSCSPGTIIKYAVNDTISHYFYVLHDNGTTLTLQQRENTVNNVKWNSKSWTHKTGPDTSLTTLKEATQSWSNIDTLTYALGKDVFLTNEHTGCNTDFNCYTNTYEMNITGKARMVTLQELRALGCASNPQSCPSYVRANESDSGYWTMSAWLLDSDVNNIFSAWRVDTSGNIANGTISGEGYGARAVIEINK